MRLGPRRPGIKRRGETPREQVDFDKEMLPVAGGAVKERPRSVCYAAPRRGLRGPSAIMQNVPYREPGVVR